MSIFQMKISAREKKPIQPAFEEINLIYKWEKNKVQTILKLIFFLEVQYACLKSILSFIGYLFILSFLQVKCNISDAAMLSIKAYMFDVKWNGFLLTSDSLNDEFGESRFSDTYCLDA